MIETWKSVVDWPEYEVSDSGFVRRAQPGKGTTVGKILRPRPTHKGYIRVALHRTLKLADAPKTSARIDAHIHILVARAFLGEAPTLDAQVDHIDGDKLNNATSNLEWVTPAENMRRAVAKGLRPSSAGIRNPRAKLTEDQVRAIRASRGLKGPRALAHEYSVSRSVISGILAGTLWQSVA